MKLLHALAAFAAVSGGVKATSDANKQDVSYILADDASCPAPSTVTVTAGSHQVSQAAPTDSPAAPVTKTKTDTVTEYITVGDDDVPGTTYTTTTTTKRVTLTKDHGKKQAAPATAHPSPSTNAKSEANITRTPV